MQEAQISAPDTQFSHHTLQVWGIPVDHGWTCDCVSNTLSCCTFLMLHFNIYHPVDGQTKCRYGREIQRVPDLCPSFRYSHLSQKTEARLSRHGANRLGYWWNMTLVKAGLFLLPSALPSPTPSSLQPAPLQADGCLGNACWTRMQTQKALRGGI